MNIIYEICTLTCDYTLIMDTQILCRLTLCFLGGTI